MREFKGNGHELKGSWKKVLQAEGKLLKKEGWIYRQNILILPNENGKFVVVPQ